MTKILSNGLEIQPPEDKKRNQAMRQFMRLVIIWGVNDGSYQQKSSRSDRDFPKHVSEKYGQT